MRVYLLLVLVAAAGAWLSTPLVRVLAVRSGAITAVRDRDVHTEPIPRMGGVAMLIGLALALLVGSRIPFLAQAFSSPTAWGVLGAATLVTLLGVADDIWELDWLTKLAGQSLAAGLMAWWGGVQLYALPTGHSLTITSSRLSLAVTVLVVVVAINAVNFVDGLDGLAAGVAAIGGSAFLLYTYLLTRNISTDYANIASVIIAVLVGACVGFLPHNVNPARIFMGDSGSMLIGLTFAAAGIVVTGQIDAVTLDSRQTVPAFLPLLLPVAVLLLPLLDMGLAVVRRMGRGKSPFHPDRLHLHHRMLQIGHSQRRAVAILYLWTALFAFGAASLVVWSARQTLVFLGIGSVVALLLTLGPLRGRVRRQEGSA
ncbi:undecaprenyl/decaprenyl-phosphate alpha-N-acetylglucosaminyl 1-phosphate transferase [Actinotalea sp. M2MS4P-6]|uniref:MraY family glycosyltransferase n=1 Tax=Actinotalea sp. M2MS4P-6 TaxID=2983762 RepID=UPI0021E398D1|nr:MraY family glycosyltransferase [Actinotalea sp. M2MS4P-6]MCV2394089.1 undecaprenyl/decaprenyl-phosphate alpha-N-acetylglucosaminyl 1-phosphate transferase [Actinotalea sp. M2MS4P-6]